MASYRTCHNCAHDPNECATRDKIKRAIAGLSVTSVKFRCPDRAPLYLPGERVIVTWLVPLCKGPSYEDWQHEEWPATVIMENGAKFIICVDDVESDEGTPAREYVKSPNLYCKVSPGKLRALNEPRRAVCACGEMGTGEQTGCPDLNGEGEFSAWVKPRAGCLRFARLNGVAAHG